MKTIAPQLAQAAILGAGHLGYFGTSAAARAPVQAAGGLVVVATILVVAFLATVARAAHGLTALLSQLLQVAASLMATLVIIAIVVAVAVALLVGH